MRPPPCNPQDLPPTSRDHRYTPQSPCDCVWHLKSNFAMQWDLHWSLFLGTFHGCSIIFGSGGFVAPLRLSLLSHVHLFSHWAVFVMSQHVLSWGGTHCHLDIQVPWQACLVFKGFWGWKFVVGLHSRTLHFSIVINVIYYKNTRQHNNMCIIWKTCHKHYV